MNIKIGDTVNWSGGWGTQPERKAVVTGIELCAAPRMKYGQQVTSVSIEDKDRCVFDLSTGNWAYGSHIHPL